MRNIKRDELEEKLKEARKETEHYKRIAEETGNLFLRETEELSKLILWCRQAEDALRKSEERFRNVYETAPLAFVIWDNNTCITDWNKKAEAMFGWNKEEVVGRNFFDFLVPERDRHRVKDVVKRMLKYEIQSYSVNDNLTKYGKIITCEWNNSRLHDNGGNTIGAISLGLDITERRRMEEEKEKLQTQLQQSQKMEAIGILTGGIAHDFNNILGVILGNTELALADIPEGISARMNLEQVRKTCLHAKNIVSQLLGFTHKAKQKRNPINLISVIEDSLKFLRATIPTSIEMRHNFQAENDTVLADSTQIHQIMINLCSNASHAMQKTGGLLEIEIKNVLLGPASDSFDHDLPPGRYLRLTVSDTGQGIHVELKDRIFDPYFTTKEVGKGTGMGLSVVYGIVKSYGGAISVDSKPGEGAVFHVYFPVIDKVTIMETKTDQTIPGGNERILFVDDQEAIVYVGQQVLEGLGYQVETCVNPLEALELFRSDPDQFDLVITDMTMPQMTGDRLVKEILKFRPDIPTILSTGFNETINEEKAKEIGIRQYIEKPYDNHFMAKIVRNALDEK